MTEDAHHLPDQAPKSCEHEKWKAMVDSVIEFISASRTMLYVLNQRLKDREQMIERERNRRAKVEEEKKVKEVFYEDYLGLSRHGSYIESVYEAIGDIVKEPFGVVEKKSLSDQESGDKSVRPELKDNEKKELLSSEGSLTFKSFDKDSDSLIYKDSMPIQSVSEHPRVRFKEPPSVSAPDTPFFKEEVFNPQSGNTLRRKPSKIPRTKSFNSEDKIKSVRFENTQQKETSSKKCFKRATYTKLHQKSKEFCA